MKNKAITATKQRFECLCCGQKRYAAYMLRTPIPNKNNDWSYCCNVSRCRSSAKQKMLYLINAYDNKINEMKILIQKIND